MKKVNIWRSTYSEQVYEMPVDWIPSYDGWELVATELREDNKAGE
jgi:hypothetical protein